MKNPFPVIFFIVLCVMLFPLEGNCGKSGLAEALKHKIRGDSLLRKAAPESAAEEYRKALALGEGSTALYFNLAIAAYMSGDIEGSIAALEEIARRDPEDAEVHYNLGCLRLYRMDFPLARLHFAKAQEVSAETSEYKDLSREGLEYLDELETSGASTQALALFLLQFQQGMTPEPAVF